MAKKKLKTSPAPHELVDEIIRVDHAGERGAINIYKGQLAVLGHTDIGDELREMLKNEEYHLATFEKLMVERGTRPTALLPLWDKLAYYVLGMGTALLGKEAAMACTDAVEEVIGKHYQKQVDELKPYGDGEKSLRKTIAEFRDDELAHQQTAQEHGAQETPSPLREFLYTSIKACCKIAISVSKKV
jgi:ubiquinone biosynthesis monooxygenase Coq7